MNYDSNFTPNADILIVDDTPDNIRFLSSLLSKQGYNVRKAINGQMALTAVKAILPDLILLDINMPGLNGYEVCEHLKKDPQFSAIPVIFLSALDDVKDKVKAFQVGGNDYISKPFQMEEILARIQHQLTIKNLQNQLQEQNAQLQKTLADLQKAQAELIQKEKMISLGQLVAGMAHEINNSIGFVSSNIEPARNYFQDLLNLVKLYDREHPTPSSAIQEAKIEIDLDFLTADLEKILLSMQTGSERICTMLLALSIFSRLNESEIKPVNIHKGIDSTLLLLKHQFKTNGKRPEIKVIKNYGELPVVTCYASQINQVWLNLLNNAIDALESALEKKLPSASEPTIWITTELIESETVRIIIKDNGIGIPENIRSRLFDPFFTTKPVGKGSGLGLVTSYQIVVEKHKGKLNYHSTSTEGTDFIVEIPVHLAII